MCRRRHGVRGRFRPPSSEFYRTTPVRKYNKNGRTDGRLGEGGRMVRQVRGDCGYACVFLVIAFFAHKTFIHCRRPSEYKLPYRIFAIFIFRTRFRYENLSAVDISDFMMGADGIFFFPAGGFALFILLDAQSNSRGNRSYVCIHTYAVVCLLNFKNFRAGKRLDFENSLNAFFKKKKKKYNNLNNTQIDHRHCFQIHFRISIDEIASI